MSVSKGDIWIFGAANHPENDADAVGGAVDTGTKLTFTDPTAASTFKMFSTGADTTQTVTVTGRNAAGAIVSEGETLNGTTGSTATTIEFERVLKVVISAPQAGVVAAISQETPESGTAQSAGTNFLQLASGGVDTDGDFIGQVLRITAGDTGVGELAEVIDSTAADDKVFIRQWAGGSAPTGTITYEIAPGAVLEKYSTPAITIDTVRRLHYDAAAPSSSTRIYYEKGFVSNQHATLSLTNATFDELAVGVAAKVSYFVEATVGGNGASANRLTEPAGSPTWEADAAVDLGDAGDGVLGAGESQGFWSKLSLASTDTAANSYWSFSVAGQSV